jgi:NADH-quinone oxidoreductase E subunit
MDKVKQILEKYPFATREHLISLLQEIQEDKGFLSEEVVKELGKHLNMPTSKIYSLATFYGYFRFQPKGRYHIRICRGTSCQLKGSESLIKRLNKKLDLKNGETSGDGEFSLEIVSCMGGCPFGPVVAVNEKYYTGVDPDKLEDIIDFFLESES